MQFKLLSFAALFVCSIAAPVSSLSSTTALGLSKQATGWTVRNFQRNCTDPNICTYSLGVDTGSGALVQCTITDTATPATTHAWYGKTCAETLDWELSWGWDYAGDFTVLTTVYKPNQTEAFFGYSHPNVGLPVITYPDVGPNAVQHV
ncbi:hypothetical protein B0O99DRAFT_705407 [Bisporella sp. PMI_857]|nr:hypothetical protein B0O99DRAFT_705407 [Bisporella sp. PMI_857]